MSWLSAVGLGLSLFQGLRGSQQAKAGASAGYNQSMYNAQQAGYFGQLNADAMMEAAGINAGMVAKIGELNAWYIERAGERNLAMYEIQSEEELRRHVRAEKMHAGSIRAAQSGTGIQVNTGANLHYLNDQIDEGLAQRHFMMVRHAETKKSIKMDFTDKAYVTRESARLQAEAIMANGHISADMALAESQFQAQSYMQQAQAYQTAGSQASSDFMWSALGSVGKFMINNWDDGFNFGDMFGGFGRTQTSAPPPLLTASGYGTPSMLSQNAPAYSPPSFTDGSRYLSGVLGY
jgi:hypothetical protein